MKKLANVLSLLIVFALVIGLVSCKKDEPEEPTPTVVTEINALSGFADGGDSVYTLDINSTNALSLSFDKSTFAWASVTKTLDGDFTTMNALNITLQGSGVAVLVKLETSDGTIAKEVQVNANTTQQSFSWDLSDETALLADLAKVYLFAAPGQVSVTGTILISELNFTVADATGNVIESGFQDFVTPDPNVYAGEEGDFKVVGFYDGGDGIYDIEEADGEFQVDYVKVSGGNDWAFFRADLAGNFSDFARLVFTFTSTADVDLILKLEGTAGNKEVRVTGTGVEQTVIIDLISLLPAQLDASNKIVIFGAPGTPGEGSITLHNVVFERALADVNTGWYGLDAGVYTPTENVDGSVTVDYVKNENQGWSVMKLDIPEAYQMLNVMTVTFQGTAGTNFIIKPNDQAALEQNVTLADGEPLTLTFNSPEGFTNIIWFAQPNVGSVSGTFTIVSVTLDYEAAEFDPTVIVQANDEWIVNDAGTYEFTTQPDGTQQVVYAIQGWQFIRHYYDVEEVAGLNTLTVVISGTAGKNVLLKPNDSGAMEKRITFEDAEPVTVVFYAEGFNQILMFAEGGADSAFGTFYIHSVTLSYTYEPDTYTDMNGYVITEGEDGLDVAYDKGGNGWAYLGIDFDALSVNGLNTLAVTLQGTTGESVLLKPNDQGALERTVAFTDENPVTEVFSAAAFTKLIMFAMPGDGTATGTFTIVSIKVYFTPEVEIPEPEWVGYGMTIEATETEVTISYENTPANWWENNAQLAIVDFDGTKDGIVFTFTGEAGQQYVLKIEGNGSAIEATVDATGVEQTYEIDLSGLTEAQRDGLNLIVVFSKTAAASGSIVLKDWSYPAPEWIGYGMTIETTATETTITYADTPANWWNNNAQLVVVDFDGTKDGIVFTFTGVAGQQYVLKIEGNGSAVEVTVDATGTEQMVEIDLSGLTEAQRDGLNLLVVFSKTAGASGSIVMKDWTYPVE